MGLKALTEPSPSDFDRWEALLAAGREPSDAAMELGYTSSMFRRTSAERHAHCLEVGREARADRVDRRMEELTAEEAPQASLVLAWAKRWNPAYDERRRLELTGADGGPVVYEGGTSLVDVAATLAVVGALPGGDAAGGAVPALGPVLAEPPDGLEAAGGVPAPGSA
jgi:hypothetical protein